MYHLYNCNSAIQSTFEKKIQVTSQNLSNILLDIVLKVGRDLSSIISFFSYLHNIRFSLRNAIMIFLCFMILHYFDIKYQIENTYSDFLNKHSIAFFHAILIKILNIPATKKAW